MQPTNTYYVYDLNGELVFKTADTTRIELFFDMEDADNYTVQTGAEVMTAEEFANYVEFELREQSDRFKHLDGDHYED